jgi:hypothetical protein
MARGLATGEFRVLAWAAIVALALLWQGAPASKIDGS